MCQASTGTAHRRTSGSDHARRRTRRCRNRPTPVNDLWPAGTPERVTGIEPALSAWEAAHVELHRHRSEGVSGALRSRS